MPLFSDIREDVGNRAKREEFEQSAARKHFITKQDIANVSKKVKDHTIIRHESDPSSVSQVVSDLRQEPFDPVLFYKAQGTVDLSHPNIPANGFVLAIQTKFQKELYEKYGHSILCIDATHGTNAYNFMLITCIVPDEFGRGTCIYIHAYKLMCRQLSPIY